MSDFHRFSFVFGWASSQAFLQNRLPELATHVDAHVAKLTEELRKEAGEQGDVF